MSNSYALLRNVSSENGMAQSRKILHSWKEIASFIGCGIRTVQRYEAQFGFPVHRPAGTMRSAVMAFSDEVEAWLLQTPTASQLVRSFNVIKMPAAGNHNGGEICPLCEGTGKALEMPAASSDSAVSRNGSISGMREQRSSAASSFGEKRISG